MDKRDTMMTTARNIDSEGNWGFDLTLKTTGPILLELGGNAVGFGSGKTIEHPPGNTSVGS
ncbi:hypothetical protein AC579_6286 [Pseudocercospora musae]|uniref:Uncharacterized protein n=1 Tax=Pseudocercospora musae TaxID=113226 RepID=A0A139IPB0_9PEZI|nr:hypothetical protein AC579_6286 [Pseudocercospora musae]